MDNPSDVQAYAYVGCWDAVDIVAVLMKTNKETKDTFGTSRKNKEREPK